METLHVSLFSVVEDLAHDWLIPAMQQTFQTYFRRSQFREFDCKAIQKVIGVTGLFKGPSIMYSGQSTNSPKMKSILESKCNKDCNT